MAINRELDGARNYGNSNALQCGVYQQLRPRFLLVATRSTSTTTGNMPGTLYYSQGESDLLALLIIWEIDECAIPYNLVEGLSVMKMF